MSLDTINISDIVLPQGGLTGEVIIGIVIGDVIGMDSMRSVVWISDERGVFQCDEMVGDLTLADLRSRDDITDLKIEHGVIAGSLGVHVDLALERQASE